MSLQRKRMQVVYLKRKTTSVRADKARYEETYTEASVSLQPLSGAVAAQMYGKEIDRMLLLLADPDLTIEEDMGVCVDAAASEAPDYEVVYTAHWAKHTVAHIRYIPMGKR